MTELRVASFNIRNGRAFDGLDSWPFRRRSVAATLAALDADVAGLQEVFGFQQRWLASRLAGYRWDGSGRGRAGCGERCPVVTRRATVEVVTARTRWFGDRPDWPGSRLPGARFARVATICRLRLRSSGDVIELACTHLDHRSALHRRQSAEQLLGWLDPGLPRLVVGDLNAGPDDVVLRCLAAGGLRQVLGPDAGGTDHNFTGRADGARIDHILVSPHFEVAGARVWREAAGQLPSDHWPVVADLRLPPPAAR